MSTPPKQRPVAEVSVGHIHAAIWRNESEGAVYYNTTFSARYKDAVGEWKTSATYTQLDLLALAKCADLAFDQIERLKKQDKEHSQ
jgi:hypothetical protein